MTSTTEHTIRLIHIARIFTKSGWRYLFLRETEKSRFSWHEQTGNGEVETGVAAATIEEALRLAALKWKKDNFTTVICGFRYTLPERDEHGINALFHQMAASYASPNGIYYDDELGNNCIVQNASEEALRFWRKK